MPSFDRRIEGIKFYVSASITDFRFTPVPFLAVSHRHEAYSRFANDDVSSLSCSWCSWLDTDRKKIASRNLNPFCHDTEIYIFQT